MSITPPETTVLLVEDVDKAQTRVAAVSLRLEAVYSVTIPSSTAFSVFENSSFTLRELLEQGLLTELHELPCRIIKINEQVLAVQEPYISTYTNSIKYMTFVVPPQDLDRTIRILAELIDSIPSIPARLKEILKSDLSFAKNMQSFWTYVKAVKYLVEEILVHCIPEINSCFKVEEKKLYKLATPGLYILKLQKVKMFSNKLGLLFLLPNLLNVGITMTQILIEPGYEGHVYIPVLKIHDVPVFIEKNAEVARMLILDLNFKTEHQATS